MLKLTRPLAVIDVETTGTDVMKDRIVEFGTTILHPDGVRTRWVQRFNPMMPIPPDATKIHGITDQDVKDCPLFSQWAARVTVALKGKDIAGYNPRRLDLPILDEEIRRAGGKLDLTGVRIIDVFGTFQKKEPRKLEDAVRRYCGREHAGAHGAGADAEETLNVLLGQEAAYEDIAAMSIDELAEFSCHGDFKYADVAGKLFIDADGDIAYAFGKHKGTKVTDEPSYGRWMLSKGDFPGSTCDILQSLLYPQSRQQQFPSEY